jgi:hypothetical protein
VFLLGANEQTVPSEIMFKPKTDQVEFSQSFVPDKPGTPEVSKARIRNLIGLGKEFVRKSTILVRVKRI